MGFLIEKGKGINCWTCLERGEYGLRKQNPVGMLGARAGLRGRREIGEEGRRKEAPGPAQRWRERKEKKRES